MRLGYYRQIAWAVNCTNHTWVCRWGLNNDELLRSDKGTICDVIGLLRNHDTPINLTQKERTDYVLDQNLTSTDQIIGTVRCYEE